MLLAKGECNGAYGNRILMLSREPSLETQTKSQVTTRVKNLGRVDGGCNIGGLLLVLLFPKYEHSVVYLASSGSTVVDYSTR